MAIALGTWLVGCSADSGQAGASESLSACNPLAQASAPILLGELLGVGRDGAGLIYALDRDPMGMLRAFVSEGDTLRRRVVTGGGEGREAELAWYEALLADPELRIRVEVSASTRMGLFRGATASAGKGTSIDEAEEIEMLDASALDALTLQNLPGDVAIEYWTMLADGRRLVVLRPEHDWDVDQTRLYFGPLERLEEHAIMSFSRSLDGGTTYISFDLDGATANAYFPTPQNPDAEATLTVDGEAEVLASSAAGAEPGAAFMCLSR